MATVSERVSELTRERALALYRGMVVIRRTGGGAGSGPRRGRSFRAPATPTSAKRRSRPACSAHLRPDDTVLSTHRGHGHALAKGVPPRELMAELFGRATGCSRGRGGSMHLFAPEVGLLGTSGIVGPSILMATGAGCSYRLLGNRPSERGVLRGRRHRTTGPSTRASTWPRSGALPVLFVCENNLYATEVPFETVAGNPNVAARGAGLRAAERPRSTATTSARSTRRRGEAVRRGAGGDGPTLLECLTYRTRAHSEGCATPATGRARRWTTGRRAVRIARWREPAARTARGERPPTSTGIDQDGGRARDRGRRVRRGEPVAGSRQRVTRHVYAETGEARVMRELTFTEAARRGLSEEMARDPSVFVVGEGHRGPRRQLQHDHRALRAARSRAACATRRSPSGASPASARARR